MSRSIFFLGSFFVLQAVHQWFSSEIAAETQLGDDMAYEGHCPCFNFLVLFSLYLHYGLLYMLAVSYMKLSIWNSC